MRARLHPDRLPIRQRLLRLQRHLGPPARSIYASLAPVPASGERHQHRAAGMAARDRGQAARMDVPCQGPLGDPAAGRSESGHDGLLAGSERNPDRILELHRAELRAGPGGGRHGGDGGRRLDAEAEEGGGALDEPYEARQGGGPGDQGEEGGEEGPGRDVVGQSAGRGALRRGVKRAPGKIRSKRTCFTEDRGDDTRFKILL